MKADRKKTINRWIPRCKVWFKSCFYLRLINDVGLIWLGNIANSEKGGVFRYRSILNIPLTETSEVVRSQPIFPYIYQLKDIVCVVKL